MLGEIDRYKKPKKPQIFLAKPNREIISKISEAYNIQQDIRVLSLNELSFNIPYYIDINHELTRNHNVDLVKERYLIKVELGSQVEWYVIYKVSDNVEDDDDNKTVYAYSLGYQLKDKMLNAYKVESYNATQVLNDVLLETVWSVDYIDADFELTYRQFEFNNTTVLDAVFSIATTFNAVLMWDTENQKINFIKPELFGRYKGLKFSYAHYLKTMGRESNADEMVTRLKAFGKDGLSINRVNSTGQNYIENYSFFMYPFERDENKSVLTSSYYMSDSLCSAILDYEELLELKKGEFDDLLSQKEVLSADLSQKSIEMNLLLNEKAQITDTMITQQFDKNMWFYKFTYDGSGYLQTTILNPDYNYATLCKVSDAANITVKLNGIQRNIVSGQWVLLGKEQLSSLSTIEVNGTVTNVEVFIQIANITPEEYDTTLNDEEIINTYSLDHKEMQIEAKQSEIDNVNLQIKNLDDQIQQLGDLLSAQNNYTPEQLVELNDYIIEREFRDENYIDDKDLYEDALKKFDELRKPQLSVKIDIVNFLEIIEEQGNWDKLVLGDEVIIEYEMINAKVIAKIIEISYDYEDSNISLTVANVRDISDESRKLEKYIYESVNTSTLVSTEKNRWGKAVTDVSDISQIFENFWNKVTNEINMASNETVTLDRKGLTIYDPDDPLRFLRATHGALALTRSGGLRYETAITADGIIAERLMGKILLTQRVTIGDDDGIFFIEGPKATISDRCGREVMKFGLYDENPDKFGILLTRYDGVQCEPAPNEINQVIVDRDDGFTITRKNGTVWDKVAWLDTDGYFHGAGIIIDYMSGTLTNGITIDSLNGIVVTRSDGYVKTILNATDGISIQQFNGAEWEKKFYAGIEGQLYSEDLIAKRLRIVNDLDDILIDANTNYMNIGRFVTIITDGKLTPIEKLTLKAEWERIQTEYQKLLYQANQYKTSDRDNHGSILIDIPPFTQAYTDLGNYVTPLLADMDTTTSIDRVEFKSYFQAYYDQGIKIINAITDALKFSSVLLAVPYNNVTIDAETGILVEKVGGLVPVRTILNATEGISIEKFENSTWVKKFYVDTDGILHAEDLIAKSLMIYGSAGQLLIDGNSSTIYLNNFDIEGVGKLTSEQIVTKTITASEGYIVNLTVNHLKTQGLDVNVGDYSNYIDIKENQARWITGMVKTKTQAKDSNGALLYWTDSSYKFLTTKTTIYPAYEYDYTEYDRMKIYFQGTGTTSFPVMEFGLGDGSGGAGLDVYGKGYIVKDADTFYMKYRTRVFGNLNQISFDDFGTHLTAENLQIDFSSKNYLVSTVNGFIKLNHSSGANFSINETGDTISLILSNGSKIELSSSGANIDVSGNINMNATGDVNINGANVHLN